MLKPHEVKEIGRSHVVVNVSRVGVIGKVQDGEGAAEHVVLQKGEATRAELPEEFQVQGEEAREAMAIRLANVVLAHVDVREGEA